MPKNSPILFEEEEYSVNELVVALQKTPQKTGGEYILRESIMYLRSISYPSNSHPLIICSTDNFSHTASKSVLSIKKLIKENCEFKDGELVAVHDVKCNRWYEEYFAFKYRGKYWTYVNGENYGVQSWKFCDHIKRSSSCD